MKKTFREIMLENEWPYPLTIRQWHQVQTSVINESYSFVLSDDSYFVLLSYAKAIGIENVNWPTAKKMANNLIHVNSMRQTKLDPEVKHDEEL